MMENKQLFVLCAVILVAACIICAGVYFGLTHQNSTNMNLSNNTTNSTNNTTVNVEKISNDTDSQKASNNAGGDDYVYSAQKGGYVKASGQYDKDSRGNTIHSYQGSDGVIYEEYYDSNGKKISSEEYYKWLILAAVILVVNIYIFIINISGNVSIFIAYIFNRVYNVIVR